jgi:hypothetical protein
MATYTDARNLLRASKGTVNYAPAVQGAFQAIGQQNLAARKYKDALDLQKQQFGFQKEKFGKEFGQRQAEFDTTSARLQEQLDELVKERERRFELAQQQENRLADYQDWQKTRYGIEYGAGTPEERVTSFWEPMGFSGEPYARNQAGQYTYGKEGTQPGDVSSYGFGDSGGSSVPVRRPTMRAGGFRTQSAAQKYDEALRRYYQSRYQ